MSNVTNVEMLNMLNIQERNLTSQLTKELSVQETELIQGSIKATKKAFMEIVYKEYSKFRQFCQDNKKLYTSFSVMFRDTDRIIGSSLKFNKKAVLVQLENTFDNCLAKSSVLIPFEFILNPEEYLETRKKYVKMYYRQNLTSSVDNINSQISKLEAEKEKINNNLNDFEFYYTQMMKNK